MKVEVWTRSAQPKKLWTGELDAIPREGDWLSINADDAAHHVHEVSWVMLPSPHVIIRVRE